MIGKKDILKIARHFVRKDHGTPDRRTMHPARDWFLGLSVVSILFCIAAAYAGFMFMNKYKNIDKMPVPSTSIVRYKQDDVMHVLREFETKTNQFENLRKIKLEPLPISEENTEDGAVLSSDEALANDSAAQ